MNVKNNKLCGRKEDLMKYCIGEFAEILGVTADTLRLYEKYNIIKPNKDIKNNYRYFNDMDARNLLMSRWYRSMQIPLQDVAVLTQHSSFDDIVNKINERQEKLEEEIKKSTMLLNRIVKINAELNRIKFSINKCEKKKIPGIYRLKQTNKNLLVKDERIIDSVSAWMNLLPYTFFSFKIEGKTIFSEEDHFDYNWGLAIYEDEIHSFDIEINENIEYFGPETCISSVIISWHREGIMKKSLQFMIDYIKDNGYSIAGDITGKILLNEKIDGESISYLEVNIPVKLCK